MPIPTLQAASQSVLALVYLLIASQFIALVDSEFSVSNGGHLTRRHEDAKGMVDGVERVRERSFKTHPFRCPVKRPSRANRARQGAAH